MTDNRTNEPTEAQVEAAAQAVREVDARAGLIADVDLPMYRARAALEAAAGAAQAPSEGDYILGLIETIKETGGAVEIHGVKIQPCDQFGNVEQPSSTVDEAALIREAKAEAWDEGYWQGINDHTGPGNPYRDCGAVEYREGSET